MRAMLDTVVMDGVVVIGEGEKDEAPMLFNGEHVGEGGGPAVDVAVDPLEGTRLTALGQPNAIAVIAVAERGSMFFPGAAVYMDKIAVGADAVDAIDINATPTENVNAVAKAKGRRVTDIRVVVLERDRHDELIGELRQAGARVNLIRDGDVAPAIAAARPETGVDMLYGVGGTPEGVISATALKCVGGGIQGKLWPRNDEERQALVDGGFDLDRVLTTDDLVAQRRRLRRRDGRHDRRAAARDPVRPRRRDHRFDRHALAVRHGAPDRGATPTQQAGALHREGILMSEIGLNELGYDEQLYILAFDHRGSFEKMVGDVANVPGAKRLIWEGFQRAVVGRRAEGVLRRAGRRPVRPGRRAGGEGGRLQALDAGREERAERVRLPARRRLR